MTHTDPERKTLLAMARASIKYGLQHGAALPIVIDEDPQFAEAGACFVTLKLRDQLRGCIGTLEARQPLARDVAENAYSAAFRDPRFSPLRENEFSQLEIHISILSPPEPFPVNDEHDLLQQLRPGIDGLVLKDGYHRATFLPSVWESLPEARQFVQQLKLKAGLAANHWSDTIQFHRYTVEEFAE